MGKRVVGAPAGNVDAGLFMRHRSAKRGEPEGQRDDDHAQGLTHRARRVGSALKRHIADAMMGSDQPLLQVPNGAIRPRRAFEAFQAVGVDRRPRRDVLLDEGEPRRLFEVGNNGHANPIEATLAGLCVVSRN